MIRENSIPNLRFGAEREIYCLAGPIHRAIEVPPLAADSQVRFVDTPRLSRGRVKTVPARLTRTRTLTLRFRKTRHGTLRPIFSDDAEAMSPGRLLVDD